jgi:hypothetical protein
MGKAEGLLRLKKKPCFSRAQATLSEPHGLGTKIKKL